MPNRTSQYVLCFTGARVVNKRMALYVEGVRAAGLAVRVFALPRGPWVLDKSEAPTVTTCRGRFTADIGVVQGASLVSVMCFHWAVLPLAVLVGMIRRVPILYDEHDHYELNTLEGSGSRWSRTFYSWIVRMIHRICLPWVTVVTCIHLNQQVLKRHLEQWQPRVIEVHNYPAVVWRETPKIALKSNRLCFVYIGGVYREKGIGAAAEAFLQLPAEMRQKAELHIFGTGDPELISELRGYSDIVVHNGVTPGEFRRFAASHRCCGLSLLANTPRYNLVGTNCTKLYEYLALGMPVIATRVGEFPEFVTSNQIGLLIDGDLNANELSTVMTILLNDESIYANMSRNASALMQSPRMTWEHEWDKIRHAGVFTPDQRAA